ncbi:hypothetical protein [uncultured Martelella sp.]|uniref:hypothetical protein n=1 Tax=uncultured Martelella sp. TaxID=392331 RepID=UPI0029C6696C|nr:hypothetical protein [uncultured Martelella sp.]
MHDLLRRFLPLVVFEGEGLGGGDGGDPAADGNGGDGGDPAGGGWKPPEGLPEEFTGADADETLGKLLGGYTDANKRAEGLRKDLAQRPSAPKTPDEYSFEPDEKLAPFFGDLKEDKLYASAREAAHKYGISQEQFSGFLSDTFGPLAEAGALSAPFDAAAEVRSFQEATGLDRAGVGKALQQSESFAKGLIEQLDLPQKLTDEAKGMFMGLTDTAAGNAILQALSARINDSGFGLEGKGGGEGALTEADLKKLDADPRIDPRNRNNPDPNKRFDEDLRKRYDEAYNRLYG